MKCLMYTGVVWEYTGVRSQLPWRCPWCVRLTSHASGVLHRPPRPHQRPRSLKYALGRHVVHTTQCFSMASAVPNTDTQLPWMCKQTLMRHPSNFCRMMIREVTASQMKSTQREMRLLVSTPPARLAVKTRRQSILACCVPSCLLALIFLLVFHRHSAPNVNPSLVCGHLLSPIYLLLSLSLLHTLTATWTASLCPFPACRASKTTYVARSFAPVLDADFPPSRAGLSREEKGQ